LALGLDTRMKRQRDDPIRALCYLIEEISLAVCGFIAPGGKPLFNWRTNPFLFQAFKVAIIQLLDGLKPNGEIRSPLEQFDPTIRAQMPEQVLRFYGSPEVCGETAALSVWSAFQRYQPLTGRELEHARALGELGSRDQQQHSHMAQARHDLEITTAPREQTTEIPPGTSIKIGPSPV
jgi:hypothetical protein